MLVNKVSIDDLYEFLATGSYDDAPAHIVEYIQILERVHGMIQRMDLYGSKEAVIKHLVASETLFQGKPIRRPQALQLYHEAVEYFYADAQVSKKAWRNFSASLMEKALSFAVNRMMTVDDAAKVVKMSRDLAEMRGALEADILELPEEAFRKPIEIYVTDPEVLGLPKVDRTLLEQKIDALPELTKSEKDQIKRDAQIFNADLFKATHEPKKSKD